MQQMRFYLLVCTFVHSIFLCPPVSFAGPEIRVGAVLPLSGDLSHYGESCKNAAQLALAEQKGNQKIHIVYEDDAFQVNRTVSAATKLVHQNSVDLLIVFGAGQAEALHHLSSDATLVALTITSSKNENVFNFFPSIDQMMELTAEEIHRRQYKRIATFTTEQQATLLQTQRLSELSSAEIVVNAEVVPTETDFRSIATKMVLLNPDGIFISAIPPQGSLFARQVRKLGFKGELFTGLQTLSKAELKAAAGALSGAWGVSGDFGSAKTFFSAYHKRYNDNPVPEAAYMYDLITLIKNTPSSKSVQEHLATVRDFNGTVGAFSANTNGGFTFPIVVKTFGEETITP